MVNDVAAGAPGVVVRGDRSSGHDHSRPIELAKQAGWTRADNKLSVRDQFRMGSNTKPMIATVILQLVAEGKVKLSDPVEKYLPSQVPNGRDITVRMLLNHTSGLFDYIYDMRGLARVTGNDQSPVTPEQLLAIGTGNDPYFAPGTRHQYSNTNYIALGLVAEKVTGRSLPRLLEQRIIRPLGLRDTYLATSPDSRDGAKLADAYEPDAEHLGPLLPPGAPEGTGFVGPARGEHVLVTSINPNWAWAAGALVSSPKDEQTFLEALLGGRLLPKAQLAEMKHTVMENPDDPNGPRYGLGLERLNTPCGPVWGHTGGIAGYSSFNYTDELGHRAVSVVTTTLFGLHEPKLGATDLKVFTGAVCAMYGKPVPTS